MADEKQQEAKQETKPEVTKEPKPSKPKKNMNKKTLLAGVFIVLLIIGAGVLAWQMKKESDAKKQAESARTALQAQVDQLTKDLADAKAKASPSDKSAAVVPKKCTISNSLRENIEASISSKNTAALEGYMAASVNVVFAASEKGGQRTPAEAVSDLDYVNSNAEGPWNFSLPAATLNAYKAGFYGQFFGDSTIVGKSANNFVISFHLDSNCKIDVVFVAADASSLTQ